MNQSMEVPFNERHRYLASYGFSDEALAHRQRHRAFSENGSYEVHEHYERKVQRQKPKKKRQVYAVRDVREEDTRKEQWVVSFAAIPLLATEQNGSVESRHSLNACFG